MIKIISIAWYFVGLVFILGNAISDPDTSKSLGIFIFLAFAIGYPLTLKKAFEKNANGMFFWVLGASIAPYISLPAIFIMKKNPERKFSSFWYESSDCTDTRYLIIALDLIFKSLESKSINADYYNLLLSDLRVSINKANSIINDKDKLNITSPNDKERQLKQLIKIAHRMEAIYNSNNELAEEIINGLLENGYDKEVFILALKRRAEANRAKESRDAKIAKDAKTSSEVIGGIAAAGVSVAKVLLSSGGSSSSSSSGPRNASSGTSPPVKKNSVRVPPPVNGVFDKRCGTCEFWSGPRSFKDRPYNRWVQFPNDDGALCNKNVSSVKWRYDAPNGHCYQKWAQIKN